MLSKRLQGVSECLAHVHVLEAYKEHTITVFCQCSFASQFLSYAQQPLHIENFRPKLLTIRILWFFFFYRQNSAKKL
jgi:hypothetical protein